MTTVDLDSLIEWRLLQMMSERRIRRVTDLKRMLDALGVEISSSQLSRLVAGTPQRLSMELMGGLMAVLDCEASDLIRRVGDEAAPPPPPPRPRRAPAKKRAAPRPRKKAPAGGGKEGESLTGPKVTPFPVPDRKK